MKTMSAGRYDELRASHSWRVPERYNIAADVCDKHPADKQAMVWESFDGTVREVTWGELQTLANQAAHMLADRGVERGDRVALLLPPTPEAAAVMFGVWKLGGILLSMSVLYGDEAIQHRLGDSGSKLLVTDEGNAARCAHDWAPTTWVLRSDELAAALDGSVVTCDTRGRRPGAALLHLRHHRAGQGHRPRPPLPARRTRSSSTATRCRTASAFTAWASGRGLPGSHRLLGPWRLGALQCVYRREGGFDPRKQLAFLSAAPGDERVHHADGDAVDDGDRATPAAATRRCSGASARRASR